MFATRRGILRGLAASVAVAVLPPPLRRTPSASAAPAVTSAARPPAVRLAQGAEWIAPGLSFPTTRLFTPTSGALLASTRMGLFRSDDGGAGWRAVGLPAPRAGGAVEVDPIDHRVIYADTDDGLQRTDDDGHTWTVVLPSDRKILRIASSPVDPSMLYVMQSGGSGSGDFWFVRSRDRGATWEELDHQRQAPCGWSVLLLTPHPADPNRLFRTSGCYSGRNLGDDLRESRDNGATWHTLFTPSTAFPHAIVGGAGLEPNRLLLSANNDARSGGSILLSSSDDGASWSPVLENTGGGTMTGSKEPNVTIGGLAYNPLVPADIYVGLNSKTDPFKPVDLGAVKVTNDGGATWSPVGGPEQNLQQIHGLALGVDGLNLYAATERGVWRLTLG
jgi:photosystem II stability/assembly factor-like uncharacterized protein